MRSSEAALGLSLLLAPTALAQQEPQNPQAEICLQTAADPDAMKRYAQPGEFFEVCINAAELPKPDALLSQCLTFKMRSLSAVELVTELQMPESVLDHCVRRSPNAVSEAVQFATTSKTFPREQAGAFIQAATEAVQRNRKDDQPQAQ